MTEISFSKYSGCGNDFILIDNRSELHKMTQQAIVKLCDRNRGIGADGVIFIEKSHLADFKMKIFNRDGSLAEMCGNGLRCLGQFILDLGYKKKLYTIETLERILSVDFMDDQIRADMGVMKNLENKNLQIDKATWDCYTLNTGVPHAVIFVDDLDTVPIKTLGAKIRHHPTFSPHGVNANFAKKTSENQISIRTFERGVEDETLACGTGAVASAIAASLKWGLNSPIEVTFRSEDTLTIQFKKDRDGITQITQTGPAVKLFHGVFDIRGYL